MNAAAAAARAAVGQVRVDRFDVQRGERREDVGTGFLVLLPINETTRPLAAAKGSPLITLPEGLRRRAVDSPLRC